MIHYSAKRNEDYYMRMWMTMSILPEWDGRIDRVVQFVLDHKTTYEKAKIGVFTWWIVAIIHMMEAGNEEDPMSRCLHNGLPINKSNSYIVGDYSGPFESFQDSAHHALKRHIKTKGYNSQHSWDIPSVLWFVENWNGIEKYANLGLDSPYLWSASNHGVGLGKIRRCSLDGQKLPYVDDIHSRLVTFYMDTEGPSEQVGAAVLLKTLMDLDKINLGLQTSPL